MENHTSELYNIFNYYDVEKGAREDIINLISKIQANHDKTVAELKARIQMKEK